jgi:phospholipid/cholesterol/gamma-HCH transport system permease protein
VLSLAGEWIVGAGPQLEAAGASLLSLARDAKSVILDLAGLRRMDTAGAWFIDRALDELAAAGAKVSCRNAGPKQSLLLKEAGYHPPEKSTRVPPPHTVARCAGAGLRWCITSRCMGCAACPSSC